MSTAEAVVIGLMVVCWAAVMIAAMYFATRPHGGQVPPPGRDGVPVWLSTRAPTALQPDAPWRAPREGGYRGSGGVQPSTPPPGTSATSRGHTPPPPRGGSGQATARDRRRTLSELSADDLSDD